MAFSGDVFRPDGRRRTCFAFSLNLLQMRGDVPRIQIVTLPFPSFGISITSLVDVFLFIFPSIFVFYSPAAILRFRTS